MPWERWQAPELETQWSKYSQLDLPAPKRWTDAYLAAFARNYNIHPYTFGTDFLQFGGLQVRLIQNEPK